jgi:hypothetical protein
MNTIYSNPASKQAIAKSMTPISFTISKNKSCEKMVAFGCPIDTSGYKSMVLA